MNYDLLFLIQQSKFLVDSPELNETSLAETDPSLPIKQWVRQTNLSQKYLQNLIVKSFKDYLGTTQDYTFTSGTQTYALPSNAIQVRLFERTDPVYDTKMGVMQGIDEKYNYTTTNSVYPVNEVNWYTIWGNNLYIAPDFAGSGNTGKLWYIKRMADLHQGTATSVTSSTIVFPTTSNCDLGEVSNRDDYYNGTRLLVTDATTGAGQIVTITDYVGSTRTATVSWDSTPTGTVKYSLLSEVPSDYVELLCARTALTMTMKDVDTEASNILSAKYNELEKDMIDGLHRLAQSAEMIDYNWDPFYD